MHVPAGARDAVLEARLQACLDKVGVAYLVERFGWDATRRWEDTLSLGVTRVTQKQRTRRMLKSAHSCARTHTHTQEQQRIGVARLFFHRPLVGVLDECTCSIPQHTSACPDSDPRPHITHTRMLCHAMQARTR